MDHLCWFHLRNIRQLGGTVIFAGENRAGNSIAEVAEKKPLL